MLANPILQERINRFKKTVQTNNDGKVVNYGNVWAWAVADNGYKLNTIARNYDMRLKNIDEFQSRYNFDFYSDFWSGNPALITDPLGGSTNLMIDEPFNLVIEDHNYMESPLDYDVALRNYTEFLWTKIMPRKYPQLLQGDSIKMLKESVVELTRYFDFLNEVEDMMTEKHGTLAFFSGRQEFLTFFLQNLFLSFSGMKQIGIDMRRYPEKVAEVCEHFGLMGNLNYEVGSNPNRAHDYTWRGLAQSFLSPKQFEKFVYPTLKKLFDYAEQYDKIIFCFWQSENYRLYDMLKEAPKGHFMYYFEKDDLFKAKKVFGEQVAIAGGMPSHMLYHGTPEECVDYAKKLIDEIGYDGKYMFGADIMLSYPKDCKRENLLAVNNFVNNYN